MKQHEKRGERNKIGAYGEQIAATFLINKGYKILDANYQKKWGEIDIVARETPGHNHTVRFVEVKTVSYETKSHLQQAVSHGTWRPEEMVTRHKLQKLVRVIDSWLLERSADDVVWQIDVIAVRIVPREKYATVTWLENIIV